MKLRNKKTGDAVYVDFRIPLSNNDETLGSYCVTSLEELNRSFEDYVTPVYGSIERLKTEIETERVELKSKLVKAEAKLKIYEAMFEKLNLNINLNQGGEDD